MADIRLLELRNTYKWGGGPDKTILLSAEQHDPTRVEVVVTYVRGEHDHKFSLGDKARVRGLTYYEIIERGKLDFRVLSSLQEIVLRHDINLIHAHDYKSDLFAYFLRRRLRRRRPTVISTMHGWALDGLRGRLYWQLDRWLLRRFDRVIAVSHTTKQDMVNAGVPSHLITVLHNGIDTDAWSTKQVRGTVREELGLDHACPVIGYVGRLSPEKDLATWLRAAALVGQRYPDAHFVVVGEGHDGTLLACLQKQAMGLGIAKQVHFLGYRAELLPVYAAFDIFVLSSYREGICNSLLEAMAMELPVVTTNAGGTCELVRDGYTGYMLPQRDAEALAHATITLLDDTALRHKMGRAGRERVEQTFSFTRRLRCIEALYATVVGVPLTSSLLTKSSSNLV